MSKMSQLRGPWLRVGAAALQVQCLFQLQLLCLCLLCLFPLQLLPSSAVASPVDTTTTTSHGQVVIGSPADVDVAPLRQRKLQGKFLHITGTPHLSDQTNPSTAVLTLSLPKTFIPTNTTKPIPRPKRALPATASMVLRAPTAPRRRIATRRSLWSMPPSTGCARTSRTRSTSSCGPETRRAMTATRSSRDGLARSWT